MASERLPLICYEWTPMATLIPALEQRFGFRDAAWVAANWNFKYVDLRIDMRTGSAILTPGNLGPGQDPKQLEKFQQLQNRLKECLDLLRHIGEADQAAMQQMRSRFGFQPSAKSLEIADRIQTLLNKE